MEIGFSLACAREEGKLRDAEDFAFNVFDVLLPHRAGRVIGEDLQRHAGVAVDGGTCVNACRARIPSHGGEEEGGHTSASLGLRGRLSYRLFCADVHHSAVMFEMRSKGSDLFLCRRGP